ncbi:MAG: phage Gp37/Gp68 family protein, partial [Proteobacteria bacterium]|nr:phage Gp37/Gp68 family protein [Pseudomonadota bacterium]
KKVFQSMNETPQHTYQVLTKRSGRLKQISHQLTWSDNIWMGVSVENEDTSHRIDDLVETSAYIKFLSLEPLIGPLDKLNLIGIDWVIVGGESGPKARPMEKKWVDSILKQCKKNRVQFFFKQWGGVRKHTTGRVLNGKTYDEMPTVSTL